MKHIILICIVLCGSAWAEWDYGTALTNMAYALEQPRATLDVSFTNRLSTWIGEATNASHVANIDLVRAISYTDIAEDDMSGDTLLPQVFLICSNIVNSAVLPTNAWERSNAAEIVQRLESIPANQLNDISWIAEDLNGGH